MANTDLPPQFLSSLRTLFDILDENKRGFVSLRDIESRWQVDGAEEGLPNGVLDALRKVTPQNGMLSFDRFVAGLKIALLRSRNDEKKPMVQRDQRKPDLLRHTGPNQNNGKVWQGTESVAGAGTRNQSAFTSSHGHVPSSGRNAGPMATVPPNNAISNHQNIPITMPIKDDQVTTMLTRENLRLTSTSSESALTDVHSNWRRERMPEKTLGRWPNSTSVLNKFEPTNDSSYSRSNEDLLGAVGHKSVSQRRREPRRHTLTNGIDFNMIKRMKQLEQERDILLSGLAVVDCAREWYQRQLSEVQEKQKYMGSPAATVNQDHSSIESQQERLNFQSSRILEVNQQLQALIDSSEKGFPLHMNLAVSPSRQPAEGSDGSVTMLKTQNRMLTQEVSQKSEKIAQLEREKAQLIREMFQAKSRNKSANYDDTTFI